MSLHFAIESTQMEALLHGDEVQVSKATVPDVWVAFTTEARGWVQQALEMPIPMILFCPLCHMRHVDKGEFATKPHHTHACQNCGMVWRPAVVHTVGVAFLPHFKDTP